MTEFNPMCSLRMEIQQNCIQRVASYPGLLAPAFVTCGTNVGEGLVKLSHVVWRT